MSVRCGCTYELIVNYIMLCDGFFLDGCVMELLQKKLNQGVDYVNIEGGILHWLAGGCNVIDLKILMSC